MAIDTSGSFPEATPEATEKQRMIKESAEKALTDPRVRQFTRSGGGGGVRELSMTERQKLAAQRTAEGKAAEIQREKVSLQKEARKEFAKDLRNIKSKQDRMDAINRLNRKLGEIELQSGAKRVEEGITTAYKPGSSRAAEAGREYKGASITTPEEAAILSKVIERKPVTTEEVRKLEQAGIKFEKETQVPVVTKEKTFLEKVKERGIITTATRELGKLAEEAVEKGRTTKLSQLSTLIEEKTNLPGELAYALQLVFGESKLKKVKESILGKSFVKAEEIGIKKVIGIGTEMIPFIASPILFVGSATEQLLTKGGKKELSQLSTLIEEKTNLPGELAYALPAVEILAGTYGVKAQLKTLSNIKAAQAGAEAVGTTQVTSPNLRSQQKAIVLENLDEGVKAQLAQEKISAGRIYEVPIKTASGKEKKLIFLEFSKAKGAPTGTLRGRRLLYGVELDTSGKVKSIIGGISVEQVGKDSSKVITKLVKSSRVKKLTLGSKEEREILTFAEEIRGKSKKIGDITVTTGETKTKVISQKIIKGKGDVKLSQVGVTPEESGKIKGFFLDIKKGVETGAKKSKSLSITQDVKLRTTATPIGKGESFGAQFIKETRAIEGGIITQQPKSLILKGTKDLSKLKELISNTKGVTDITQLKVLVTKAKVDLRTVASLTKSQLKEVGIKGKELISKLRKLKPVTEQIVPQVRPSGVPTTLGFVIAETEVAPLSLSRAKPIPLGITAAAAVSTPSVIGSSQVQIEGSLLTIKPFLDVRAKAGTIQKVKQEMVVGQQLIQLPKQAPKQIVRQAARQQLVSKSLLSQAVKLELALKSRAIVAQRKAPQIETKPIIVPILSSTPTAKKQVMSLAKQMKGAFEVQVRREGEFKVISEEPLPKGKALKLGQKAVEKSLARTFKLVPKGTTKQPDIEFELSPVKFRKPRKQEDLTFIQKKELAFGTKLETTEAQKARKLNLKGNFKL